MKNIKVSPQKFTIEAIVNGTLVRIISDGSENGTTVISEDPKMGIRIKNTVLLGIKAPYTYDSPNTVASYTPLGMMSALESLARGRVSFTILPEDTRKFLKNNFGGYASLGWTG